MIFILWNDAVLNQEPIEPGDTVRIGFGNRDVVCLLSLYQRIEMYI